MNIHAMKRRVQAGIMAGLMLFSTCAALLTPSATTHAASSYSTVRVLLSTGSAKSMEIEVEGQYNLTARSNAGIKPGTYTLSVESGQLRMVGNGINELMGTSLTLVRTSGSGEKGIVLNNAKYGNCTYWGDLTFKVNGSALQVINKVPVEQYLYGVVGYEMSNSFPIEALKTQAISARGYVLRAINGNEPNYEIGDTSRYQVYHGYPSQMSYVKQAVNETKGQVLTYNGKLIETFYSASNGGQTELPGNQWGGGEAKNEAYPYLAQKDDPYDLENTASRVEKVLVLQQIQGSGEDVSGGLPYEYKEKSPYEALQQAAYNALLARGEAVPSANHIRLLQCTNLVASSPMYSTGNSRLYKNAVATLNVQYINNNGATVTPPAVQVTISISKADTSYFSSDLVMRNVEKASNGWNLVARRYGHGVGMSQRGAQWMAQKYGKSHQEILAFYFTGSTLSNYDTSIPAMPAQNAIYDGGSTPPPAEQPSGTLAVKGTRVNVRAAASTAATSLGKVNTGDVLPYYNTANGWHKVQYNGQVGYIYATYGTVQTTTPTPTPTPPPTPSASKVIVVTGTNVRLRKQPSTASSSGIITSVNRGFTMPYVASSNGWHQGTYNGQTAYVSADYSTVETKTNPTPTPTPTPVVPNAACIAFVKSLYTNVMGREADSTGLNFWANELSNHRRSGSQVVLEFIESEEFEKKSASDKDFLTGIYKAFMGREPDQAGYDFWLDLLEGGMSRRYVLSVFCVTEEFQKICKNIGATYSGIALTRPADRYPEIAKFVIRFYRTCLERKADEKGLDHYVSELVSKKMTAAKMAKIFYTSEEFEAMKLDDTQYVTSMYTTFMDRKPDESGLAYWVKRLADGDTHLEVLSSFIACDEFTTICKKYGIQKGSL